MTAILPGPDGQPRCRWCAAAPEFPAYHDHEWGFPVADDRRLFEKLCLESFQSGLSWRTILAKRENFRAAFCNFDFHQIARFDADDVARLLADPGIVRHRGKICGLVHIYFTHFDVVVFLRKRLKLGSGHFARTAPIGIEIYKNGFFAARYLVSIVLKCYFCHGHISSSFQKRRKAALF